MEFPLDFVRGFFPALEDSHAVFFDNAAGAQVPRSVIEAVGEHLTHRNVQRGGRYKLSQEVDGAVENARESLGLFVNAYEPDEIVLGLNASSFIRQASLAIADTFKEGDQIIVTELDHEANIAPWLALEDRGIQVKFWRLDEEKKRLAIEELDKLLTQRTRLVAVTKASNALGTIVDLIPVAERIHAQDGYLFVDAVQFAPHGPLDVRFLSCDFLVCSGYKVFGPHMGFMWGRKEILDSLPAFKEYFVPDEAPGKFELGTFNYEAVSGMNAAIGYIEELGRRSQHLPLAPEEDVGRRGGMRRGMQAIRHYERILTAYGLEVLGAVTNIKLYGVVDPDQAALRTPTFLFSVDGMKPSEVSHALAEKSIFVRDGHMYCPRLMKTIGLSDEGAVRASLVHYNSTDEIDRLAAALKELEKS